MAASLIISLLCCVQALAVPVDIDPKFDVDPSELKMNEIAKSMKDMNTAVMGIAELIVDIDKNVRSVQATVLSNNAATAVKRLTRSVVTVVEKDQKAVADEALAQKIEKMLATNNPQIEKVKDEIAEQVRYNFLKTLSAILITGPVRAQQRQQEIFKLMRKTLNGELDFKPVVEKMPFLLRETETNRFIMMLKTIRENERTGTSGNTRQFGGLQNAGKILDSASKLNFKEIGNFLKEIPEIFEGVETIVDGADEYFN